MYNYASAVMEERQWIYVKIGGVRLKHRKVYFYDQFFLLFKNLMLNMKRFFFVFVGVDINP